MLYFLPSSQETISGLVGSIPAHLLFLQKTPDASPRKAQCQEYPTRPTRPIMPPQHLDSELQ